jgi:hypothetical protein
MEERHLHMICMDVPFPPDYGGVFDLFYKIKALHQLGIQIHLHCFEYGRGKQSELEKYCSSVAYYQRREGHKGVSHKLPYIVCSRSDESLLARLLQDDHPVLAEGIHCSYLLNDERFAGRKIFLRIHNVEYLYYRQLFVTATSIWKKIYYLRESIILKKYERQVADKASLIAVSRKDALFYKEQFGASDIRYLSVFLPFRQVSIPQGTGCYCLYHGNLSVAENEKAVNWLLEYVFNDLELPLVIAGKNPSGYLLRAASRHKHVCLIADPSEEEIQDMIRKAQVHVLPSFNVTGIKLKLLNALFNGRHCVVNRASVDGTGLESLCHIGSDALTFKQIITKIYHQPFSSDEICRRRELLGSCFNNERNAEQLIRWIW